MCTRCYTWWLAHLSKGGKVGDQKELKQGHRTLLHRTSGAATVILIQMGRVAAREWMRQGIGPSIEWSDGPMQLSPMVTYVTQQLYFMGAPI